MVKKYHKNPEVVEALQLTRKVWDEWEEMKKFAEVPSKAQLIQKSHIPEMVIMQREPMGEMVRVYENEWIIKAEDGSLSKCTPEEFEANYTLLSRGLFNPQ